MFKFNKKIKKNLKPSVGITTERGKLLCKAVILTKYFLKDV